MSESENNSQFRVDLRLLPPVVLAMLLGSWIMVLESHSDRLMFLIIILAPFYYLGAEILARKICLDSEGITIRKLLRHSKISWKDISYVDAMRAGKKVFLIIESHSNRPNLLTNTLGRFPSLVNNIIQRMSPDKVSDSARDLASEAPGKYGPLLQAWAACLILSGILIGKLLGYG